MTDRTQLDENVIEQVLQEILTRAQFRKWPAPEVAVALARAAGSLAGRAAASEEQLSWSVKGLVAMLAEQARHDFQPPQATAH